MRAWILRIALSFCEAPHKPSFAVGTSETRHEHISFSPDLGHAHPYLDLVATPGPMTGPLSQPRSLPTSAVRRHIWGSECHPVTGVPSAKVIHNFGCADTVDRDALARLVASISRFLDPAQAVAAAVISFAIAGCPFREVPQLEVLERFAPSSARLSVS